MSCFSGKKSKKEDAEAAPIPPDQQPWATAHLDFGKHPSAVNQGSQAAPGQPKKAKLDMKHKKEQSSSTNATAVASIEDVDAITPAPRRDVYIDPIGGHSNVTIPARPSRKHTFSECFDLDDIEPGGHVRSPSGNLLSVEQAAARTDRPMGIKERQLAIRKKVSEANMLPMGNQVTVIGDVAGKKKEAREKEAKEEKKEKKRAARQVRHEDDDDENERPLQGGKIGCGWCYCYCQ